jgi:hypothetical protein
VAAFRGRGRHGRKSRSVRLNAAHYGARAASVRECVRETSLRSAQKVAQLAWSQGYTVKFRARPDRYTLTPAYLDSANPTMSRSIESADFSQRFAPYPDHGPRRGRPDARSSEAWVSVAGSQFPPSEAKAGSAPDQCVAATRRPSSALRPSRSPLQRRAGARVKVTRFQVLRVPLPVSAAESMSASL